MGPGGQREDGTESSVAGISPHTTRLFGTVTPEPDNTLTTRGRANHPAAVPTRPASSSKDPLDTKRIRSGVRAQARSSAQNCGYPGNRRSFRPVIPVIDSRRARYARSADLALGQMSINWNRRWAAEASSSMSDRSEVTTAHPRRSAVSATVASTGPTVSGSVRRNAPALLAGSSESASTSQPSRRRARLGCRPPRQASTTQPAGTTGSTPRCMARACSAQMRRSFASAAMRAPVS